MFNPELILKEFPVSVYLKEECYQKFYKAFKDDVLRRQAILESKDDKKDLNQVLVDFSYFIGKHIGKNNTKLMQEVLILCNMIREFIVSSGSRFLEKRPPEKLKNDKVTRFEGQDLQYQQQQGFQEQDLIQVAPKISNKLVVEYFPQYLKEQLKTQSTIT